ncbi:ATP-binding protein [Intrasporangium sp.]|uniref:sensor histidine kinase n=1 Tax=Intrasporangium sp. TaxID=1925024 RepID=UPI0032221DA4
MRPVPGADRSAGAHLRTVVVGLVVLIALGAVASLVMVQQQGRAVRALTLAFGPAVDANGGVLLEMARARDAWFEQRSTSDGAAADPAVLEPHRVAASARLDRLLAATRSQALSASDRSSLGDLAEAQQRAVEAWFTAAERSSRATSGVRTGPDEVEQAWVELQGASTALAGELQAGMDTARSGFRMASAAFGLVVVGVAALSIGALLLLMRRVRRTVVQPLERLSEVVRRQAAGNSLQVADTEHGAAEVRSLARNFNELHRQNSRFLAQQGDELRMRRLVLEVARGVRAAATAPAALDAVCRDLGQGLGADRVLLYTLDEDAGVRERSQWHADLLPDLPPLPASLTRHLGGVEAELRELGNAAVLPDVFDPEWAGDERVLAFHRATGARSVVLVPVGSGDQGLGVLAVLTVDQPRWWLPWEVRATEQSGGLVSGAVVQFRLAGMREEQVRRLTELDHQKTDFMATVSHELRTPLTSITGYLELVEDGDFGELTSGQQHALGVVHRNAVRLRGLIEDLLVLNKIESTGLPATLEDVPVRDLVRCVVETMEPAATEARVSLLAGPVPEDLVVRVDRTQFERALLNLGSNAVKFTPSGGSVTIEVAQQDDAVRIRIADTGIGIPQADLARLSERFFRAGNAMSAAIPGTGLGLAIVRTIVDSHGGRLDVESVEGEGTTMVVSLPPV